MSRWVRRPEGSNWGEFGEHDQVGRMNLITPERRLAGLAEVKDGVAFCLSLPLDLPGGAMVKGRAGPKLFAMPDRYNALGDGAFMGCCDVMSDDAVTLYTQYSTQWDALSHWGQTFDADGDGVAEKVYYNGYRAGDHIKGPERFGGPRADALGIEQLAQAAPQGRAALVNLHRIYGDAPVDVGYDALMRAFEAQKVEVGPGDFLLIHTGIDRMILGMAGDPDRLKLKGSCPALDGADERLHRWVSDSGVAALCSDNLGVEAMRPDAIPAEGASGLPLHTHALFKLGVHFGEMWLLAELADYLWARGRSACFLTAPPLRLPGAVGSPANPIATV